MTKTTNWKEQLKHIGFRKIGDPRFTVTYENMIAFIEQVEKEAYKKCAEVARYNKLNLLPLSESNIPHVVANKMQESRNSTCEDIAKCIEKLADESK